MQTKKSNPVCRLVTEFAEINTILQLENNFFSPAVYQYEHAFLAFAFKEKFDSYAFLDNPDFLRRKYQYSQFISFLKSIGSSGFYVSCPPYCGLYPLEISVDCPFETYNDALSYVLERTRDERGNERKEPIGHPMRGAGFVIMPIVFVYDQTKQWAIVFEDSVTPVATIGVKASIDSALRTSLSRLGFTSAVEVLDRPSMAIHSDKKERLLLYGKAT